MKILGIPSVVAILVSASMSGCSTLGTQPQVKADVVMKAEGTVRLFHKERVIEFCVGETVPIYRYYGRYMQSKEIGKAKIVNIIDEHYLEAAVVEGEIRAGDVAKKNNATCLVQLPGSEGK